MEASDLHSFQVGLVGFLELHGNVGFKTKHVGRTHFTFQIDQEAGIDPLEFDQPGRNPKRTEPFGDGKADLAAQRRCRSAKCAVQAEGSLFHPFCRIENLRTFRRQPDAVDVAGYQCGLVSAFQLQNPLSQSKFADAFSSIAAARKLPMRATSRKIRTEVPVRYPSWRVCTLRAHPCAQVSAYKPLLLPLSIHGRNYAHPQPQETSDDRARPGFRSQGREEKRRIGDPTRSLDRMTISADWRDAR